MSRRRAETWPGRVCVRRSLAAGRVAKPGRAPVACRSPARSCVRRSLAAGRVATPGRAPVTARRGPARRGAAGAAGPARPHGEVRSGRSGRAQRGQAGHGPAGGGTETVQITRACRRVTDRARRFATFWKEIEKND